jgi:hypothetical protein
MEHGVVEAISRWSLGQLETSALEQTLLASGADIHRHRVGFRDIVDGLNSRQIERCQPLIDYAFSLLDLLEWELSEALSGLRDGDRDRVFTAGDHMSRASFQLNQTFVDTTHQALAALGPTEIPSLNHLLALKRDYLAEPCDHQIERLRETLNAEQAVARHSLQDLRQEPDLPEVVTLRNAFEAHLSLLERLLEDLGQPSDVPYTLDGIASLEKSYTEISALFPLVQMLLRSHGPTRYPDLNLLLKMLDSLAAGEIGDSPVMEALESLEVTFTASQEDYQQSLLTETSVLVAQEIKATLECFDLFHEGLDAVYHFLDERALHWLEHGQAVLRDFGTRLQGHHERFEQLHAQQGKVLCPYCASFSEQGSPRCQRCSKPLPVNLGLPGQSSFEFVDHQRAN